VCVCVCVCVFVCVCVSNNEVLDIHYSAILYSYLDGFR